jgi:DNA-binding transcriptional regulator YiaG
MTTLERINAAQSRLGLDIEPMAQYLGVSVHTLRKWQNGQRIPGAMVDRLLDILAAVECMAPQIHATLLQYWQNDPPTIEPTE